MSAPARAGSGGTSSPLPLGTVIGGRFRLQQFVRSQGGTDVYQATDNQGGGAVLLRILAEAPAARAVLDADLASVARLHHRNLTEIVGLGDYAGMLFVAAEAQDGHTLRELIDAQKTQGKTIGLDYARTLLGHVVHGLEGAAQVMSHGGLNPDCVWITRSGRVKVGDLGLTRGVPRLARRGGPRDAPEGLYLAPEVARGAAPGPASDVYSLAAILYELCTGLPPVAPIRPPSQVSGQIPPAVDAVMARAMAAQVHARFASPGELVTALGTAAGEKTAGAAPSPPPSPPAGMPPVGNPGYTPTGGSGPRITLGKAFDPTSAAGLADNDERWLIQKDRLDYGPFSLSQVMAQIERGAFKADHLIVDVDSGERQKIKDHPRLGPLALSSERRLETMRRAQAEHVHETVERKKSRATLLIIGGAVAALAIGLTIFLTQRKAAEDDPLASRIADEDVDQFLKNVKFNVASKPRAAGPGPGKKAGISGGGARDEFSTSLALGDVTQGGGDDVLSDGKVQQVMMGNYRKLVPCIMQERRRNGGLSDIDLDFIVLGSGKVSAVRVNGQRTGPFPACVLGRMQSFSFPPFDGKRTVASWSMSMR